MVVLREILSSTDENVDSAEVSQLKQGRKVLDRRATRREERRATSASPSPADSPIRRRRENENFYISKVDETNEKNALAVGDRLLAINSRDTSDLTHDQAVQMLKNGEEQIELVLYREKPVETSKTINDNSIEVNQRDQTENDVANSSFVRSFRKRRFSKAKVRWV